MYKYSIKRIFCLLLFLLLTSSFLVLNFLNTKSAFAAENETKLKEDEPIVTDLLNVRMASYTEKVKLASSKLVSILKPKLLKALPKDLQNDGKDLMEYLQCDVLGADDWADVECDKFPLNSYDCLTMKQHVIDLIGEIILDPKSEVVKAVLDHFSDKTSVTEQFTRLLKPTLITDLVQGLCS